MKLKVITHRLEIAFWHAAIPLIQKRSRLNLNLRLSVWQLNLLAMVSFLVVCWLGSELWQAAVQKEKQSAQANNTQKTLLVVVNDLSSKKPELEGVWIVVTPFVERKWMILPVYPFSLSGGKSTDTKLERAFGLKRSGALERSFTGFLADKDISWDHYVVVDRFVLDSLIAMAGGARQKDERFIGSLASAQPPSTRVDAQVALLGQAKVMGTICSHSVALFRDVDPQAALDRFERHLYTDDVSQKWVEQWFSMRDYGWGLQCELPTLTQAYAPGQ
jgi:thymidylate kinase